MGKNTDYFEVPGGRRHLDEVEYMHGVSAPLVVSRTVAASSLTGGQASQSFDFAEQLPLGAVLITAWVEGTTWSSSSGSTTGATVELGPSGGDTDGWMAATSLFASGSRQGAAGALWGAMPPRLAVATTPAIKITATGGAPDLAHLTSSLTATVTVKLMYRRTVAE